MSVYFTKYPRYFIQTNKASGDNHVFKILSPNKSIRFIMLRGSVMGKFNSTFKEAYLEKTSERFREVSQTEVALILGFV